MWTTLILLPLLLFLVSSHISVPLVKTMLETNSFLNNTSNTGYIANIWLGSPAQEFQVYISTWTTVIFNQQTFVPGLGSKCTASKYFDTETSTSFIGSTTEVDISVFL